MVEKLETQFEKNIDNNPLINRKYTLTHCDDTGERYLFVGSRFAEERFNKLRDEVVGEWIEKGKKIRLHIMCNLYSKYSRLTENERYEKFKKHMPRAIIAIINGDKKYIKEKNLSNCDIYVYFLSDLLPSKEHYGKVSDYLN